MDWCTFWKKSKDSLWTTGMIKAVPRKSESEQICRKTKLNSLFKWGEPELLVGCKGWTCGIIHILSFCLVLVLPVVLEMLFLELWFSTVFRPRRWVALASEASHISEYRPWCHGHIHDRGHDLEPTHLCREKWNYWFSELWDSQQILLSNQSILGFWGILMPEFTEHSSLPGCWGEKVPKSSSSKVSGYALTRPCVHHSAPSPPFIPWPHNPRAECPPFLSFSPFFFSLWKKDSFVLGILTRVGLLRSCIPTAKSFLMTSKTIVVWCSWHGLSFLVLSWPSLVQLSRLTVLHH